MLTKNFDISDIQKIGLEIAANGKDVRYVGDIKLDNLKIEAGGSEATNVSSRICW